MAKVPLSPESRASFAAKTAMNKGKTPEVKAAGAAKLKEVQAAAVQKQVAAQRAATIDQRKEASTSISRMASRSNVRARTTNVSAPKASFGPSRTSPSLSQDGRLGGAHAGGQGISEEEMFAGKGPSKLGGLGALGARIVRATEGEVPLP